MSNTPRSLIEKRRDVVQREALRGKSTRQIEATFAKAAAKEPFAAAELGMVNPETGKAWDHTTISRDLTYLEKQWRDEALRDRAEYKMRELAELREHRRAAWQAGELAEVRQSIMAEVALMGTKAVDISLDLDLSNLSDEQLQRIAQGEDPIHVLATTG